MHKNSQMIYQRQNGYALLSVLWVIAFIGSILTHSAFSQRINAAEVEGFIHETEQNLVIESAFFIADALIKKVSILDPVFFEIELNDKLIVLNIRPISGKLDLNKSSPEQISDHLFSVGLKRIHAQSIARDISQGHSINSKSSKNRFQDVRELKNLPSVDMKTYDQVWTEFNVDRPGVYALLTQTRRHESTEILTWLRDALNPNSANKLDDDRIIKVADEGFQRLTRDNIFFSIKAYDRKPNGAVLREHRLVHLFRKDTLRTIAIF